MARFSVLQARDAIVPIKISLVAAEQISSNGLGECSFDASSKYVYKFEVTSKNKAVSIIQKSLGEIISFL